MAFAEANARAEPDVILHEGGSPFSSKAAGPLAAFVPRAAPVPPNSLIPNDEHFPRQWALFNEGTFIQGEGRPGADIKATEAWELETGESWVKVGIVDTGMNTAHPDFAGRATGDPPDTGIFGLHGTFVAGIAAAQGNNDPYPALSSIGIAGVAWNVGIINVDKSLWSDAQAVARAYQLGAHVTNNSYGVQTYSVPLRLAFADGYRLGRIAVASMGNHGHLGNHRRYPAGFGQGVIAVGGTTNEDARAPFSTFGDWIDVSAPAGHTSSVYAEACNGNTDCVYATIPLSPYYDYFGTGTSFAAPHVTGLAALLISFSDDNLHYHPDDVEQLIRRSADDLDSLGDNCQAGPGFDPCFGTGRINARAALDLLGGPATLTRGEVAGGGTIVAVSPAYTAQLHVPESYGLKGGAYAVVRYTVERTVPIGPYQAAPHAWGRGGGLIEGAILVGWGEETNAVGTRYSYGLPYTEVASVSATSVTLRTFVYEVYPMDEGPNPPPLGFYPTTPADAAFAYTLLGVPCSMGACSGVREGPPLGVVLDGVRPNPLGERGEVSFTLPAPSRVRLAVYDVLGREVTRLVDEEREAGAHRVRFETGGLPAGVYVVRLVAGTVTRSQRMTRLR